MFWDSGANDEEGASPPEEDTNLVLARWKLGERLKQEAMAGKRDRLMRKTDQWQ